MADNKSISVWKNHLQEEIDASYLYKILAGMDKNEKQKDIYSRLSEVEKKAHKSLARFIAEAQYFIERREAFI